MSKELVIANEKQIVSGISKAFNKMESAKKGYVYSVIELGEKLNSAKELVPFGQWEKFLNANSELAFGIAQAQKFMLIANNKALVLEFFDDEQSINSLTRAIANVTPEQIAEVERIKKQESDKKDLAEATLALAETARILKAAQEEQVIEGVFEEVTKPVIPEPEPELVYSEVEELHDLLNEQHSVNAVLQKDNDSLVAAFESNDALAEAMKKIMDLNAKVGILNSRINSMMNTAVASANQLKSKDKIIAKQNKIIDAFKSGTGNESI